MGANQSKKKHPHWLTGYNKEQNELSLSNYQIRTNNY